MTSIGTEKKLKSILLIDDNTSTNFMHEVVLDHMNCVDYVKTCLNGYEGLEFLKRKRKGKYPRPDLILVDLSMPVMDGWEFLQQYEQLEEDQKAVTPPILLTSSMNPDHMAKAKLEYEVYDFINKPLTGSTVKAILSKIDNEEQTRQV